MISSEPFVRIPGSDLQRRDHSPRGIRRHRPTLPLLHEPRKFWHLLVHIRRDARNNSVGDQGRHAGLHQPLQRIRRALVYRAPAALATVERHGHAKHDLRVLEAQREGDDADEVWAGTRRSKRAQDGRAIRDGRGGPLVQHGVSLGKGYEVNGERRRRGSVRPSGRRRKLEDDCSLGVQHGVGAAAVELEGDVGHHEEGELVGFRPARRSNAELGGSRISEVSVDGRDFVG